MAFEKIKNLPTTFYGKFFENQIIDEIAGYQEIGRGMVSLNAGNPVVIQDDGKITCLFRLIKGQAKTIIVDGVQYTEKTVPAGVNTYAGVRALLDDNEFAVPYPTNELIFPLSAAGKTLSKCEHTTDGQINHPNQLNQQAEAIHELYDTMPDFLEAVAANQAEWAEFDPGAVTSGVATALDGVSDHETRISATEKIVAVATDLTDLETNYPAAEYKIGIIPNPSPPRLYLSDGTNWVENVGSGAATFRVSSTVPKENGSLIKSGNIVVNFNTNIDAASISGQITLVDGMDNPVAFTTSVNGNVLTINPDSDLSLVNKAHTLTLGAGISNLAGDMTLGTPVVLHFNTNTAPDVPTNLAASNKTSTTFRLSWDASTDSDIGDTITYEVFKDGVSYQSGVSNTYLDISSQTKGSSATWTVRATDNHGNSSVQSSGLSVKLITDDFSGANGAAPDTNLFSVSKTASASITLNGSGKCKISDVAISDGALLIVKNNVAKSTKTRKLKEQVTSFYETGAYVMMGLLQKATSPVYDTATNINNISLFQCLLKQSGGSYGLDILYWDNTNAIKRWDITSGTWIASGNTWIPVSLTTDYVCILETTATQWRIVIKNADESSTIATTTWVNWTDTRDLGQPMWLVCGDQATDNNYGTMLIDFYDEI